MCGQGHANAMFLVSYNGSNCYCLFPIIFPIIHASRVFFLLFSSSIVKTNFVILILYT